MPDFTFLRRTLVADAVVSGAAGLLMAFGAGPLHELLEVPERLLLAAGAILIPYALELVVVARRRPPSLPLVWAVIATNVSWAVGSALLLISGILQPNALGCAFILAQAIAAAGFGEIQYLGLRKAMATA